jgi:hypothetical protein
VRADDEKRVLLPLDLGDECGGGAAAHDLARRRSHRDIVASSSKRTRGGVALQVFVEVVRYVGASSGHDRRGDVVRGEKRQFAVHENRCLPCRLAALFGTVDTHQDATEHRASLGVRRFSDGVHRVVSIPSRSLKACRSRSARPSARRPIY